MIEKTGWKNQQIKAVGSSNVGHSWRAQTCVRILDRGQLRKKNDYAFMQTWFSEWEKWMAEAAWMNIESPKVQCVPSAPHFGLFTLSTMVNHTNFEFFVLFYFLFHHPPVSKHTWLWRQGCPMPFFPHKHTARIEERLIAGLLHPKKKKKTMRTLWVIKRNKKKEGAEIASSHITLAETTKREKAPNFHLFWHLSSS